MSSDQEYEVEKIEGVRTKNGKKYYHVKWKGYSSADNTWEPADSLKSCKAMIKEFEDRQTKGKSQIETEEGEKAGTSRDKENPRKGKNSEFEAKTKFKVLKRIVSGSGSDQQVSFKVLVKKTQKEQTIPRQELLEQDALSLCLFYEEHIVAN